MPRTNDLHFFNRAISFVLTGYGVSRTQSCLRLLSDDDDCTAVSAESLYHIAVRPVRGDR